MAEGQALQELEARIKAEEEALEAAKTKSRAEEAAAGQARELSDSLIRVAQAVRRSSRRAMWLKRIAFAGAALAALAGVGASWYTEPVITAGAVTSAAAAPSRLDAQSPVTEVATPLNLRAAAALQDLPAEH